MSTIRFIHTAAAVLLCALAAVAVPARRGIHTLSQPDSTTINVEVVGDEHFHTFVTATDRLPVRRQADGQFQYIDSDGNPTGVAAHDPEHRTATESAFIKANAARLNVDRLAKSALAERRAAMESRATTSEPPIPTQVPVKGSPRIPILLVSYSDVDFLDKENALQTYREFFNTSSKSAYNYFSDQSNGLFTPQFDVYGPIKLTGTRADYGSNNRRGNDSGIGKMVAEACLGLAGQIDFSNYDNDGDSQCDVVVVLYAGVGEATATEVEDAVWPCQWELSSSDYRKTLTLNGTTINKFAVFNEVSGFNRNEIDGVGTFCHEFSHCLGLPDFYETTYMFGYFGMDVWSVMHYGCYNDNGRTPVGYTAYEKNFMGWTPLPEAEENTHYTLPVWNQKDAETDQAIRISNPDDSNEYFVIENRARQGWDEYMDADGLLIYRVAYNSTAWYYNTVNNNARQRMTPIPADNNLSIYTLSGDLWPYGNATALTSTTEPATILYNNTPLNRPVTEMVRNDDGTISFWYVKDEANGAAIDAVTADSSDGAAQYFNLQGMRVNPENLTPGIYIRHNGASTEKIVVH